MNEQNHFDFDEPDTLPVTDLRAVYLEQIRRDLAVLREPAIMHQPSTAFFEERIASYREACRELCRVVLRDEE